MIAKADKTTSPLETRIYELEKNMVRINENFNKISGYLIELAESVMELRKAIEIISGGELSKYEKLKDIVNTDDNK